MIEPWLKVHCDPHFDISQRERLDLLIKLNSLNESLMKVYRGQLDFDTWCAMAESYGVPIDDFLKTMEHNFTYGLNVDLDDTPSKSIYLND
jgi:hypothetical protein